MNNNVSGRAAIRPICRRRLDLKLLIDSACEAFVETFAAQGVSLEVDVPQNLWVELDPILMREALRRLLENAAEAMPHGGVVTITSLIGRNGLEIEIADCGPGISEEMHDGLFKPFVSDKEDHAGLGLSTVREIALVHQGSITATDCPDGGAAFTLLLPLPSARMAA